MTNSEAIKQLIYVRRNLDEYLDEDRIDAVNDAIFALERNSTLIEHISNLQNENTGFFSKLVESEKENDKLKAENEQLKEDYSVLARQYNNVENSSIRYYNEVKQLKSELEQWQSTNLKLVCELTRIECENNQLKSELEQSVKLQKGL